LFSIVNGFLGAFHPKAPMALTSPFIIPTISHCDLSRHAQSGTDRRFRSLRAIKGNPKNSATDSGNSSDKVKEMASFLSIQLMEKVMNEAMKPEGESNVNLEAVERLTKALQMSSSQPSSENSPTTSEAPRDSSKIDDANLGQVETTATTENGTAEVALSMPSENTEIQSDDASLSITEDNDISSSLMEIETSETIVAKTEIDQIVAPVAENVQSPPQTPDVVRKPLEIIQSDIPPLRPESIPRKTRVIAEDDEQEEENYQPATGTIEEAIAVKTEETGNEKKSSKEIVNSTSSAVDESFQRSLLQKKLEIDNAHIANAKNDSSSKGDTADETKTSASSIEEIDSASVMESKKTEESFRRRLLTQKFEFDSQKASIENDKDVNLNDEREVDTIISSPAEVASGEVTDDTNLSIGIRDEAQAMELKTLEDDIEPPTTEFPDSTPLKEETQEGESIISNILSESSEIEAVYPDLTAQRSAPIISERLVEAKTALRQPKSSDEELILAEKYAQMENLEDRAYALLCDLGMTEEHQNPKDPSYDHSKDDK